MKRSTAVLAALAALVVLGMGYALFLVLGDPEQGTPGAAPDDIAAQPGDEAGDAAADDDSGRRHAQHRGGCAIFGEVRRAEGNAPISAQRVVLIDGSGSELEAVTDSGGAFRFAGLAAGGPYEVRVAAPEMAVVRLPGIALDRREERDLGTLLLDAAAPVTVQVRSLRDTPIAGAEVHAYAAPQVSWNFDWSKALAQLGQAPIAVARVTTDESGTAAFDGLAAGTWSFVATKQGFARSGQTSVQLRAGEEAAPITLHLGTGHSLSGRVLDENREPIANALVLGATDQNPYDIASAPLRARAVSDAEGRFALTSLAAGDLPLWAGREGDVPMQRLTVRVPDVDGIDLVIPSGSTVTGTVTEDETGEPLEGAVVQVYGGMGSAQGETDAEGRYEVATPGGGPNMGMAVQVKLDGYYQVPPEGGMVPLMATPGGVLEHDVKMAPGVTLSGTVNGPDGPVAGARVMAVRVSPTRGFDQRQATADAQGQYSVSGLEEGTTYVFAMAPGLYTAGFDSGIQNWWMAIQSNSAPEECRVEIIAGEDSRHDVEMAAGRVVLGRVETEDGAPVADARVSVYSPMGWGTDTGSSTLSDEDGAFRLEGVLPTPQLMLIARKPGLVALPSEPLALTSDAEPPEVVVRMTAPVVVRGTVTLDGGAPPEDASVTVAVTPDPTSGVVYYDPQIWAMAQRRHPVAADGVYAVELPAAAGQLIVTAVAPGHGATASKPAPIGAQKEITVDLALSAGAAVEGRVIDARSREPVEGALVRVTPRASGGNGMELVEMERMMVASSGVAGMGSYGSVLAISDADGRFHASGLAEGDVTVSAEADGYVTGNVEARAPTVATGLEVPLAPELEIRGRVLWPDGSPVAGVLVNAAAEASGAGGMQTPGGWSGGNTAPTTDDSGAFVIGGLADGRYTMSVTNSWQGRVNFLPYDGSPVPAGSTDVTLVLREGLRIAGTVVDDAGKPLVGVWLWAMPMEPKPGQPMTNVNTQSGSDGTFELVGLAAIESGYRLQANAQNQFGGVSAMPMTRESVQAGTTGLRIVMSAGLTIEGVLVDETGEPMSNVWLTAMPVSQPGQPGRQGSNAMVEAGGKFAISGLGPGPYTLVAQSWGNGKSSQLIVNGGEQVEAGTTGLRLTASKGAVISGIVVDSTGNPVLGAQVRARTEGGRSGNAQVMHDGTFEVSGLDDGGVYVVEVFAMGKTGATQEGVTTGTEGLRFVLGDGVECSGRVLDADGEPVSRGALMFMPTDRAAATRQRGVIDEDGTFTVSGLAEGVEYRVQAHVFSPSSRETLRLGTIRGGDSGVTLRPEE